MDVEQRENDRRTILIVRRRTSKDKVSDVGRPVGDSRSKEVTTSRRTRTGGPSMYTRLGTRT